LALIFAFLGGLILNLMPCVFPVISFKILSFVKMAGSSRRITLLHGVAFAVGVLVSFWLFAGMLLLLKSYGLDAGWGFQLQQPLFVAFLASILLVFALSLFGVFEFGVSVSALAGDAQQKAGGNSSAYAGSFFSGMLATALATPCTGPFMAPALGFAATLPAFWSMTIFTSLGLGMAFPYLILSAYPSLLRFLPRPGAWMNTFKELMGFMMLITVLWLISVFAAETGTLGLLLLLTGFLILSIASWVYGRCCVPSATKFKRYFGAALTGLFALGAVYVINASAATPMIENQVAMNDEWENFSAARLQQLKDEGKPVFIDFTAKWCLVCQANHLVLSTEDVCQKMKDNNVVKMKADWTRSDPEITALLREFGRNGVPLYVLYGADSEKAPQVLPQLLTPGSIIEAIEKI
jgi:thiol:disulfide interchange protein DsbD